MTETNDDFKEEVIELVGDGGDVLKFIHIGTIDYKSEKFVFFQPAVEEGTEEESDEVVVFKISKNGEDDVLLNQNLRMSCDRVLVDTKPRRYCLLTCSNSIAILLLIYLLLFLFSNFTD